MRAARCLGPQPGEVEAQVGSSIHSHSPPQSAGPLSILSPSGCSRRWSRQLPLPRQRHRRYDAHISPRSTSMSTPSLVIRNGTIVDGSGGDPYEADLAVDRRQDRRDRRQHSQGRRGDRRARQARHAGLRRRPHALRCAGDLERPAVAVVLERRHDRAVRQLRRRLRALPRGPARHADQPDGGRGGHSRGRAEAKACRGTGTASPTSSMRSPPAPTMPTSPPRCRTPRCASM